MVEDMREVFKNLLEFAGEGNVSYPPSEHWVPMTRVSGRALEWHLCVFKYQVKLFLETCHQGGIELGIPVTIGLPILHDLRVLNTEVTCFYQPSALLPLALDGSIETRGCESLEHIREGLVRPLLSFGRNEAFNHLIGGGLHVQP